METQSPYTRRLSRQYPGLFIILLDQSGSMGEPVAGEAYTKADYATTALNDLVFTMAQEAGTDNSTGYTKKLVYLSVLGYNDTVYPLLGPTSDPIDITFLSEHPRGMEPVERQVYDVSINDYRPVIQNRPFWIDKPEARGMTQMAAALNEAHNVIGRWLMAPPEPGQAPRHECFPPVIVNITDAEDNGAGDPVALANFIKGQGTLQGNNLIFTCHLTSQGRQPCVFPASTMELMQLHPGATKMFDMSSVIPEALREKAKTVTNGRDVAMGSRTFVYNANADLLVRFLKWGTVGTAGLE